MNKLLESSLFENGNRWCRFERTSVMLGYDNEEKWSWQGGEIGG